MKYFFLSVFILSGLVLLVTCNDDGLDGLSYGLCEKAERRCTGTKLEICSKYQEWTLIADCADAGGECIHEKDDYYCTEEVEKSDEIYEWEDEEEVQDDGGSQMLDNFGSSTDEDVDDSDVSDQSDETCDQFDESEISDGTSDEDVSDEDADDDEECDEDVVAVCGNEVLECGEICEKNDVKDCVEIDPVKFTAGKAICDDTCMDYNTVTCVE